MGLSKEIIEEQEKKKNNKLEGYKKHLKKEEIYNMDCPYCCDALSNDDAKKEQCVHCGHILEWNNE